LLSIKASDTKDTMMIVVFPTLILYSFITILLYTKYGQKKSHLRMQMALNQLLSEFLYEIYKLINGNGFGIMITLGRVAVDIQSFLDAFAGFHAFHDNLGV